ncbi:MAG TPA: 6-carboxytetrahydropterin synthase [Chthoniobacterales bacterium]|jgi:6-pyruvoyltetrahydropterin/6-carboxytetrahydropterin synthase|nr:6-carboxytetrahydropterin synthase [Chthoniobacterales bacterium]
MLLTVSKRLEFSASRRLRSPAFSEAENLAAFGLESAARYGTGRNYVSYFVFTGEVNPTNGMLVNISEIKRRVEEILHARFDHKFLNEDHPAFRETPPTAENIARQLFSEVAPLFSDLEAALVACHLVESPERSATFYADGATDENHWLEFSAARQTMSPHLSPAENEQLFGVASAPHGHGHYYRARFTFGGDEPESAARHKALSEALDGLRTELDHKNLNHDVVSLTNRPKTTESLAQYLFERVASGLPLQRVRLHERDDFFAEYWSGGTFFLGMRRAFGAAHRLHAPALSAAENADLYGKCNNPRGHGHRYLTEATIGGSYDARSGTLYNFLALRDGIDTALAPWQDKHLDLETEAFRAQPSTGENIVRALWPRMDGELDDRLVRLRLWETPNNRFTVRCGPRR